MCCRSVRYGTVTMGRKGAGVGLGFKGGVVD